YFQLISQKSPIGQFKVIVPAEPVDTTVGSSIVLPCRLSPEMSAAAMEVRWFKENFDNLVFLYKEGKETEGSDYRSRVRLFRQEMERGNVSLLLQNVRISDQGLYKCHVSSVDWYEEPQLQLRVTREYKRSLVVFCRYVIQRPGPSVQSREGDAGARLQGQSEAAEDEQARSILNCTLYARAVLEAVKHGFSSFGVFMAACLQQDWISLAPPLCCFPTGTFKLIVPSEPVAASVASDVVLPCQLSPEMSAAAMDVRWYRENFENLVFLYKEGKETEGSGYRGRVRLFKQEMERGNVSLLLQNVRISDQGSYTCHVSSAEWYEEPKLGLRVRRQGNRPEIEIGEIKKDSLKLTCHSEGWFPEPQMFWTDKGGRKLSSDVKPASQPGKDSPYSITSHLYMKKTDNEGVVCMVA
uniref:Ig-like domain-containing protein n=1 Tax=Lepisosteus oculatus TaxID=7918 RepID=W5M2P5_LEPOC